MNKISGSFIYGSLFTQAVLATGSGMSLHACVDTTGYHKPQKETWRTDEDFTQ